MTITTIRPGDEILLDAATAPARATMHTSKIAARNLRHNSLFYSITGELRRAQGTPRQCTIDGQSMVVVIALDPDGLLVPVAYGINEQVPGVVGAI